MWEGQPNPPTPRVARESPLLPGLPLQKGPEAKLSKEATGWRGGWRGGGGMLFQLKREFSSVVSYKINIQNLAACQTPQNNCNKIY